MHIFHPLRIMILPPVALLRRYEKEHFDLTMLVVLSATCNVVKFAENLVSLKYEYGNGFNNIAT